MKTQWLETKVINMPEYYCKYCKTKMIFRGYKKDYEKITFFMFCEECNNEQEFCLRVENETINFMERG